MDTEDLAKEAFLSRDISHSQDVIPDPALIFSLLGGFVFGWWAAKVRKLTRLSIIEHQLKLELQRKADLESHLKLQLQCKTDLELNVEKLRRRMVAKDNLITRQEEEIGKQGLYIKEMEDEIRMRGLRAMYDSSLIAQAQELKDKNERQAERLRFFRGMGCPPPSEELELDEDG